MFLHTFRDNNIQLLIKLKSTIVLKSDYFPITSIDRKKFSDKNCITLQEDKAGEYLDIISFNRYNAWYHNPGRLDSITNRVIAEAEAWHRKYNKPVLMTEYGADTMPGLHEVSYRVIIWISKYNKMKEELNFIRVELYVENDTCKLEF